MKAKEALKIIDKVHNYPCPYGVGGTAWSFIRNCIEKQTPKKPTVYDNGCGDDGKIIYDAYDCPNCDMSYDINYDKYDYCPNCGQKLDWSDGNDIDH